MNTAKLRTKRVLVPAVPAVAVVAVLGVGGTVWTATANDDVRGGDRDRVSAAAVEAVGGGEAVDVEKSGDPGEAYEVEVRLEDGSEVDVALDDALEVVSEDRDDADDADDADDVDDVDDVDETDDRDDVDGTDGSDADDRALGTAERRAAEKAALAAVGGGTVLDVDAGDDRGEAYEVEVRDTDGTEWDVELDADHQVLRKTAGS